MAGEGGGPSPPSHTIQCRRRLALMTFSRGSSESHRAFLRIRTPWPCSVASSADRCAERSGRHRCERLGAGSSRCGEPALRSLFLLPPHPAVFSPPHVPRMPLPRRTPSSCSPATGDGAFGRDAGFSGQRVHLTLRPQLPVDRPLELPEGREGSWGWGAPLSRVSSHVGVGFLSDLGHPLRMSQCFRDQEWVAGSRLPEPQEVRTAGFGPRCPLLMSGRASLGISPPVPGGFGITKGELGHRGRAVQSTGKGRRLSPRR